jgi:hypothetical protein
MTPLATFEVEQIPRRALEGRGERFERRDLDALQRPAAQDVVGRGDGEAGVFVELMGVGDLAPFHVPRDGGQVPCNHGIQDSLKLPLAPDFKLAYNTVTPQRTVTMTATTRIDRSRMTAAQIVTVMVERYGRDGAEKYLRRQLAAAGCANYAKKYAKAVELVAAMES